MDKKYVSDRRDKIIKQLIGLFAEGKLTSERANGLAGALNELKEIDKERLRRQTK